MKQVKKNFDLHKICYLAGIVEKKLCRRNFPFLLKKRIGNSIFLNNLYNLMPAIFQKPNQRKNRQAICFDQNHNFC